MTRHSFALAASLVLAVAPVASAQTFGTDDPTLRRIWTLGMDSSRLEPLAQVLLDSIGPRLTGSPGMESASRWVVAQYRSWGIPARTERYGTWRGWRRGASHIDLLQPRVRSLEGTLLAWSPGTNGRDVDAPAIVLPDAADSAAFAAWLPSVRGKYVLVSAPQASCRSDDNWEEFARPESYERHRDARAAAQREWSRRRERTGLGARELQRRLEGAGARGVVTSLWTGGWGVTRVFNGRTERIPVVELSCEDYGLVYRLAEKGQGPVLRVNAEAQSLGEVPVFNTIAEIRGSEKPDEYVVLSAHFDSWDGASGATDNGTGTVTMMEAMRILKSVYPNPRRTILVGHWSGEEQGLNGSRAFAKDHPEVVAGLQVLLNQDDGTGRIRNISMQGLTNAGGSFTRWLAQMPSELTEELNLSFPGLASGGGSDHASFACAGAPAFMLGSLSWDYGTYTWHTNRDTYDKLVFDDLRRNAIFVAMLAYLASEDPERVPRDRRAVMPVDDGGRPREWPVCRDADRSSAVSPRM
ncbi:MAG TPA: M20/M25/M40 family metallo-hydrolase [Gemmatimonadaceae bacterium]